MNQIQIFNNPDREDKFLCSERGRDLLKLFSSVFEGTP